MAPPNLINDYMRYCGVSRVPPQLHQWAIVSAIAAAARDRVWVRGYPATLTPALYVFLIGPSGSGKDTAINTMLPLLQPLTSNGFRRHYGSLTAGFLQTFLATKQVGGIVQQKPGPKPHFRKPPKPPEPKVYLVTPELRAGLVNIAAGRDLVSKMTALYDNRQWDEGTRTHGLVGFEECVVNWLAGTTLEWLRQCVTPDDVEGGFFGRICTVVIDGPLERRIAFPRLAKDAETLRVDLQQRLVDVAAHRGEMVLTPQARAAHEQWVETRPEPGDRAERAAWERSPALVLKLAMVAALADATQDIDTQHLVRAQRWVTKCAARHMDIVRYIRTTPGNEAIHLTRELVKAHTRVTASQITRHLAIRGYDHLRARLAVETLVRSGVLERIAGGGEAYQLRTSGGRFDAVEADDGAAEPPPQL